MPQELHVLRCFSCETFQVDIVKKVPKWSCKMCGEKQSLKKVYGQGTGKDCRLLVQELNQQRLTLLQELLESNSSDHNKHLNGSDNIDCARMEVQNSNKWTEYVMENAMVEKYSEEDENFTFAGPLQKRRRQTNKGNKFKTSLLSDNECSATGNGFQIGNIDYEQDDSSKQKRPFTDSSQTQKENINCTNSLNKSVGDTVISRTNWAPYCGDVEKLNETNGKLLTDENTTESHAKHNSNTEISNSNTKKDVDCNGGLNKFVCDNVVMNKNKWIEFCLDQDMQNKSENVESNIFITDSRIKPNGMEEISGKNSNFKTIDLSKKSQVCSQTQVNNRMQNMSNMFMDDDDNLDSILQF